MRRLAGYLVFCWLAVAFYTLSGATSPRSLAFAAGGLAVACALATAWGILRARAARRLRSPRAGR